MPVKFHLFFKVYSPFFVKLLKSSFLRIFKTSPFEKNIFLHLEIKSQDKNININH